MAKKFTNVETYLGIIFLFLILVFALQYLGAEVITNSNSNLDNDSIDYIANLNGINTSRYSVDKDDIEDPVLIAGNGSQGNPKDESLDFLFAKEKGFKIELIIKGIFSLPQVILIDMLRFQLNDWVWIISLFNWLYRILIIIALVYFVRGILS